MHFRYGLRFMLHSFIRMLFKDFFKIALGQMLPNSILLLNAFIVHCAEKVKSTSRLFFYTFKLQRSLTKGFYQIYRQDGGLRLVLSPSSNKGWHQEWVFVRGRELLNFPWFVSPLDHTSLRTIEYFVPNHDQNKFNRFCELLPEQPWPVKASRDLNFLYEHQIAKYNMEMANQKFKVDKKALAAVAQAALGSTPKLISSKPIEKKGSKAAKEAPAKEQSSKRKHGEGKRPSPKGSELLKRRLGW